MANADLDPASASENALRRFPQFADDAVLLS
jgi:hypothetical protein